MFKNKFLEEHLIKDKKKHKFALVIPGGGYSFVNYKVEGKPYIKKLLKKGYHVFVLNYRVKEEALFPNPIEDISNAIKYIYSIKEKHNIDINDYILIGSSAGSHMALMFSISSIGYKNYNLDKPHGLILAYPVVTMKDYTHISSREYLLGINPSIEMINNTSIELNISSDFPKVFFMCGKNDTIVNPLNSINLKKSLDEKGVDNVFKLFENAPHGCNIGSKCDAKGWFDEAIEYMIKIN